MQSRIANTKRNMIWGIINKIMIILPTFILRTLLINILGAEYLGLDSLFTSILQVLSIAELGFDNAIVYCLYKPIAEKDNATVCALLNFYKKVYNIIGYTILIIGLFCLPILHDLIKGSYPADINIYVLYVIYLLNTFFSYVFFAYNNGVIKAHQREDIKSKVTIGVNLIMYIIQSIVLIVCKNYYLYIILLPISTIMINVIKARFVRKYYPQYICGGELNNEYAKSIKKNVLGAMVLKICGVCRNSFDSIILSAFIGLVILAKYQNYYFIIMGVIQVVSIIRTSVGASIGNSIATESIEKNYMDFKKYSFIMFWIVGWCTICLFCLFQPFIELWVGKEYLFDMGMVALFCIYFYCLELGEITYVYREAAGLWWEDRYRPIIESVANLSLNLLLVSKFGVYGVIASTIISMVVISLPWTSYILFNKYFKKNVFSFYIEMIKQISICVALSVITYMICGIFNEIESSIVVLVCRLLVCIVIPNLIWVMIYHKKESFNHVIELVKKILNLQR